ncbi:hypothetical protein SO802_014584 [Lithocarpus litseifolius]|uniref:Aminotransferase-like plant mobile domain-containing protein n=1 Tax=Lithocarpus litseifolius TaxID=425828 RepID=A0AAW2CTP6_9ROSI
MARREELLGSDDVNTAGVVVQESEVIAGVVAEEVGPRESLLPLQDPWYSSSLFPAVGALEKELLRPNLVPATSGWFDYVEQEVADEGFFQILRNAKIFKAMVLSRGWNIYRDVRALRFLVRRWHTDTHTFFFPWGEITITLEDVERICLLPSMGDINPLELELSDKESKIAGKLLETFRGTSASWGGNRARFSFWISEFREFENVDIRRAAFLALWMRKCVFNSTPVQFMKPFTFPLAVVLCRGVSLPLGTLCLGILYSEFDRLRSDELEGSPYHIIEASINVLGFTAKILPNARPESQEFRLNEYEKINNFLLITSPSFIPYPRGDGFGLTQYNPHRVMRQFGFYEDVPDINTIVCALSDAMQPLVHGTALEYWASKAKRVLVASRHREGYATPSMNLYWRRVMSIFLNYVNSREVEEVVIGPPLRELSLNTQLIPNTRAASGTKSSVPATASASSSSSLKQYRRKTSVGQVQILETSEESGDSGGIPSEYDLECAATDFGKLLFLVLVSSLASSPDVLCSLGPIDEDIKIAGESPGVAVTTVAGESSKEHTGKDPDAAITTREAAAGVPSQKHVVSPIVHVVHHSKEPPKPLVESSGAAIKGMSLEEFLEKFAKDEEDEKVATDFYPLSSDTITFQQSEIPVEDQPLLAAIVRKHPHFMAGCKLGAPLRKLKLMLLVTVLLDMQRTKLESSNLRKALECENALKDLLFMKFRVQFILDKIRAVAEACIARDDEFFCEDS